VKKYKNTLKSIFLVNRFLNYYYREEGIIFLMHRVAPLEEGRLFANENMKITPQFLDDLILKMGAEYVFITLDELYLSRIEKKPFKKKFIIFTFDDGYSDNYTNAYPIFKKYNIPFTIYLTTGFPDRKVILWWYIIEDLILRNEIIELMDGSIFICSGHNEKTESFFNLRNKIIQLTGRNIEDRLKYLFSNYNIDYYKKVGELALTWEQIIEMRNSNLCTIAAHSITHPSLKLLDDKDLIDEIVESKNTIELKIRKEVAHFAYPFGTSNEVGLRECDIIRKLKFKTAVMANGGKILHNKKYEFYSLPRLNLTQDFSY
jgi:peptidoglycan/xylan/chitin deacetylase (PgdA/CDA1 family)